jgi:hypothetical protein
MVEFAAIVFNICIALIVMFQCALAAGMPLGEYTMGGKYPGRLPVQMRITALFQALVLVVLGILILGLSGLAFEQYAHFGRRFKWIVVGFCALSLILNFITPSKKERFLWVPVVAIMLICSIIVALKS